MAQASFATVRFVLAMPTLVYAGAPQAGGSRMFLTHPEHLLTSFHTILIVEFGGHLPIFSSF